MRLTPEQNVVVIAREAGISWRATVAGATVTLAHSTYSVTVTVDCAAGTMATTVTGRAHCDCLDPLMAVTGDLASAAMLAADLRVTIASALWREHGRTVGYSEHMRPMFADLFPAPAGAPTPGLSGGHPDGPGDGQTGEVAP